MGKFYVLNEIFEEIGLVISHRFNFLSKTSYLIVQNLKFTHAKFLLCSQKLVDVNQSFKLKRYAKFGYVSVLKQMCVLIRFFLLRLFSMRCA